MLFFCVAGMGAMSPRPGALMIWSLLAMTLCVLSLIFVGGWGGIVSIVLFFVILWIDWYIQKKPNPKAPKTTPDPKTADVPKKPDTSLRLEDFPDPDKPLVEQFLALIKPAQT